MRNLSNVPVETDAPRLFSLVRGWLVRTGAWVGRQIGGHAGVFGNPTYTTAYFEVTDTTNVPYVSIGLNPSEIGSEWLNIGYWDRPGIRLVAGQIVIDAACITGTIGGSGASGWFVTVDGQRVDVVNGLVTNMAMYIIGGGLLGERPHRADPQRAWPMGPNGGYGTHHLLSGLTPADDHPQYADADSGADGGTF